MYVHTYILTVCTTMCTVAISPNGYFNKVSPSSSRIVTVAVFSALALTPSGTCMVMRKD